MMHTKHKKQVKHKISNTGRKNRMKRRRLEKVKQQGEGVFSILVPSLATAISAAVTKA